MTVHDVDGLNAGFARLLLEDYLENPESVPAEWRALFESGDSDLVATHPAPPALPGRRRARPGAARRSRGRDGARQGPPDARASCGTARPARVAPVRRP